MVQTHRPPMEAMLAYVYRSLIARRLLVVVGLSWPYSLISAPVPLYLGQSLRYSCELGHLRGLSAILNALILQQTSIACMVFATATQVPMNTSGRSHRQHLLQVASTSDSPLILYQVFQSACRSWLMLCAEAALPLDLPPFTALLGFMHPYQGEFFPLLSHCHPLMRAWKSW